MNNLYTPYIDLILCIQYIYIYFSGNLPRITPANSGSKPSAFLVSTHSFSGARPKTFLGIFFLGSITFGSHFCNFWAMPNASTKSNQSTFCIFLLVGGWATHLKNMLVKLEIFPNQGWKSKNIWNRHPVWVWIIHHRNKKKECRIPEKRIKHGIWMDMLWVMPWNGHLFFHGGICFKGVVSLILQTPNFVKRCSDYRGPGLTHSGKWGFWGFQDKICMSSSNKYSV